MFNLYITDAVDSKVSIYTINEYYGKDYKNYLDWTNKVDHSKEIIINSASLIEGKNYQFKWTAEKDYYNDLYLKASKKTFGNFTYEVEDTFKTGDKVWQLPFAQYVPVNMNGLVIPQIYTIDNGVAKTYKGKGLLTFYNGLYIGKVVIRKDDLTLDTTYQNYPVVHHFNFEINDTNFLNPKWDLHFETREVRFDKIDTVPTLNLFNRFHEKNIKEITSKSSKLIEIYIKLTSKEILSIDFKKLIMIEGVLYKLNLISDFDSDAYESTKVELLKFIP